ncbi:uncharacterized protein LOC100374021 [Saccoglossus kowalevskii]|uniref:Cell number regulator 11-like n=1 Tax=Saccoglossus kowalevskii TaxID=10224 RepID=A0ABM0GRK7_SACKO|nr:PREDICTED: cell number regulator 11-like [Saccoglossus kowalevskii]
MPRYWSHGLCGCFGDLGLCCLTYFLPCVTAGRNAEAVGKSCLLHGLSVMVPILHMICAGSVRGNIRDERDIVGGCVGDMLLHCFCSCCALIQEAQELKIPAPQVAVVERK